jgi:DNA-binding PadR family transcriptional regulator
MTIHLGEFEQLILLALLRLDGDAYGVAVHDEIVRRTGRRMSYGTVYATLSRLEAKGMITSRLGEPTAERGGRRKKYFTTLAPGRRALERSLQGVLRMAQGIDTSWGIS